MFGKSLKGQMGENCSTSWAMNIGNISDRLTPTEYWFSSQNYRPLWWCPILPMSSDRNGSCCWGTWSWPWPGRMTILHFSHVCDARYGHIVALLAGLGKLNRAFVLGRDSVRFLLLVVKWIYSYKKRKSQTNCFTFHSWNAVPNSMIFATSIAKHVFLSGTINK